MKGTQDLVRDQKSGEFTQQLLEAMNGETSEILPEASLDAMRSIYASAYCYYQNGKYSEACTRFRLLVLMDAQNRTYWLGLGATQQMLKEYDKALQTYTLTALMDAHDPHVYVHMADCLFALNQTEKGLQCIAAAEQIAGKDEKFKSLKDHLIFIRKRWLRKGSQKGRKES
jgi:type III secretion system low calcium response chaperone LcrH/SycD